MPRSGRRTTYFEFPTVFARDPRDNFFVADPRSGGVVVAYDPCAFPKLCHLFSLNSVTLA